MHEKVTKVYFVLLNILGDNLGINTLSGFATFFRANFFCRFCKIDKRNSQKEVLVNKNLIKTVENYDEDKYNNVTDSGIKEPSDFNRLSSFHVVTNKYS